LIAPDRSGLVQTCRYEQELFIGYLVKT
jgi:hypothetical protein